MPDFASEFLREYLTASLNIIQINDRSYHANGFRVTEISGYYSPEFEGILASSSWPEITGYRLSRTN